MRAGASGLAGCGSATFGLTGCLRTRAGATRATSLGDGWVAAARAYFLNQGSLLIHGSEAKTFGGTVFWMGAGVDLRVKCSVLVMSCCWAVVASRVRGMFG